MSNNEPPINQPIPARQNNLTAVPAENAHVCTRHRCNTREGLLRADHPREERKQIVCRNCLSHLWGVKLV